MTEVLVVEWKINKVQNVQVDRFEIIQEDVTLPNRTDMHFSYVNFSNGVCILPITDDGRVICIRQYRHAVKEWQWELPAGAIDHDDKDPLSAAKRELEEETGFQAANWIDLGSVFPSPGSTSEQIFLFAATNLIQKEQKLEATEQIDLHAIEMTELNQLINSGQFKHGAGLAAVLRYMIKKEHETKSKK
ncbi:NUDIX hydrolase [Neobacillus vireti]|uniref:NUDIX hydrolase n=1 Tax=Neobacillus vireti TaxID=220686 RepID=UPI002FFE86FA